MPQICARTSAGLGKAVQHHDTALFWIPICYGKPPAPEAVQLQESSGLGPGTSG